MHLKSIPKEHISEIQPIIRSMQKHDIWYGDRLDEKETTKAYHQFVQENCVKADGSPAAYHEVIILYPDTIPHQKYVQRKMQQYFQLRGVKENETLWGSAIKDSKLKIDILIGGNAFKEGLPILHSGILLGKLQKFLMQAFPESKEKRKFKQDQNKRIYTAEEREQFRMHQYRKNQTEKLAHLLDRLFQVSSSIPEFLELIKEDSDLKLYEVKGKLRGIKYQGQKYRFDLLGICDGQITQLDRFHTKENSDKNQIEREEKTPLQESFIREAKVAEKRNDQMVLKRDIN